jgi:hypothetical protein
MFIDEVAIDISQSPSQSERRSLATPVSGAIRAAR